MRRRTSSRCRRARRSGSRAPPKTIINRSSDRSAHGFWTDGRSRSDGWIAQCNSALPTGVHSVGDLGEGQTSSVLLVSLPTPLDFDTQGETKIRGRVAASVQHSRARFLVEVSLWVPNWSSTAAICDIAGSGSPTLFRVSPLNLSLWPLRAVRRARSITGIWRSRSPR